MLVPSAASSTAPRRHRRLHVFIALAALGCFLAPGNAAGAVFTRPIAHGTEAAGAVDLAYDGQSRSAVVAWAAADGVWMRRLSLETGLLEPARLLMRGRGLVRPQVDLLPTGGAAPYRDLLLVVEREGRLLAQGFGGDGAPLADPVLLSRGLPGVHSGFSTLVIGDSVVVAWAHVHRGQRVLLTRVDRTGRPLFERRTIRTPALQPLLAERPAAAGPGFLVDTLDGRGHALRAFDLDGEQVSVSRFREVWRVGLLPRDEVSILALAVTHDGTHGRRVEARSVDGLGSAIERLGRIGPAIEIATRLTYRPLEAATDEEHGLAVTYGRDREPGEFLRLDLFVFDPDLKPRRGRGHQLAEGRVTDVSPPVWTERGEVLVAWNDVDQARIVVALVPAVD